MLTYRSIVARRPARIERLFNEALYPRYDAPAARGLALDVAASDAEYTLTAAVPGLRADDLQLEVLGDTVTIRGEIAQPEAAQDTHWLLRERPYGKFERTVVLPTEVNGAEAQAAVENGVLTIRLPKAETARPKQIKVTAK